MKSKMTVDGLVEVAIITCRFLLYIEREWIGSG